MAYFLCIGVRIKSSPKLSLWRTFVLKFVAVKPLASCYKYQAMQNRFAMA
jgi:hypothetical protein